MRQGKRVHISGLNFIVAPNVCSHARLGLAVSGKYGNAVKRNRLKRCLRNAFRQHEIRKHPVDILVIPGPKLRPEHVSLHDMNTRFNKLLARMT